MSPPRCHAVIPAAGQGLRMGTAVPKQYLPLVGATVIEHSLQALLAVPAIVQVVVAIAPDDTHWASLPLAGHPRVMTVPGGAERADSVLNALQALPAAADDWVLVHDAVRPCIRPADIQALITAVADDPVGGLLAVPLADTLKREQQGRVAATLDRRSLWRAQTPQVFRFAALRDALQAARAAGVLVTDEAQAMERLGHAPRLVAGHERNLKVTRPDDLALAAYWLAQA